MESFKSYLAFILFLFCGSCYSDTFEQFPDFSQYKELNVSNAEQQNFCVYVEQIISDPMFAFYRAAISVPKNTIDLSVFSSATISTMNADNDFLNVNLPIQFEKEYGKIDFSVGASRINNTSVRLTYKNSNGKENYFNINISKFLNIKDGKSLKCKWQSLTNR